MHVSYVLHSDKDYSTALYRTLDTACCDKLLKNYCQCKESISGVRMVFILSRYLTFPISTMEFLKHNRPMS